jgi:hypothetical protein
MTNARRLAILFTLFLSATALHAQPADAKLEFFEKKIRPVLVEHCYQCHSTAKKQKGGLALDSRAGVSKGGESGPAVVAGKPGESLLLKAMRYTDPELQMPPKGKLPATVLADFEKWIALGAPDPRSADPAKSATKEWDLAKSREFWSFQPLVRRTPPTVKTAGWAHGSIDRFILAELEKKGLNPARDADRSTLIRRAYFALTGLPPTPEQVDAFVRDKAPDAFARVVDELLASPHFGERWGRHWLDVARFAESSGGGRSLLFKEAWRYRDYVIKSFNSDKPYDRFLAEQIAGDLLPFDSLQERTDNLVATAYLLLGPINYEEQDKPVLEMDIIDEQLDTIGKGILGMTIGCARCHDHKFDPIPTRDYYALAGILRSTHVINHANVSQWLERPLPMPQAQEQLLKNHDATIAALKEKIRLARDAEKRAGKDQQTRGAVAVKDLPGIVIDDESAKKVGSWKHSVYSGNFVGKGYLYDDREKNEEKTLTFVPTFKNDGVYEVRFAYVPHPNRASKVPVRIFHADGEVTIHVDQRKTPPIDGRFISLGKFRFEAGDQWFVMVSTDGADGFVVADAVQFLSEKDLAAKVSKTTTLGELESTVLEAKLKALEATAPKRLMAMAVEDAAQMQDCAICIRGNPRNRGPIAPRSFLQVIGPASVDIPAKESGRRQLAAWLTAQANPLTPRVMANRIWQHLIGSGLVRTVDNFGHTGELPSHPELLDHPRWHCVTRTAGR